VIAMLETLDNDQIETPWQMAQHAFYRPFFINVTKHRHHRWRGDKHRLGASSSQTVAVFAGFVKFVMMARMLNHRDTQALFAKIRNELLDERGLANPE